MLVYLGWQYNISFSQIMSWFDHYQPHLVYSTIEYHPIINIIWCRRVCTLKIPNLYHFGYVNHFDVCFPHKWKKNWLIFLYTVTYLNIRKMFLNKFWWMMKHGCFTTMWSIRGEMLLTIQNVDAIYIMGLEGSYLSFSRKPNDSYP